MAADKVFDASHEDQRLGQHPKIVRRGGKGEAMTSVPGEPLPPTQTKGTTYTLVDPTKNKSGRR